VGATGYSPAYQRLIADDRRLRELLEGSSFYDATFAEWEQGRRFIASAVNRGGAFLDIGCGNGFLLRCLQEWSRHAFEPFGIDTDEPRLVQAKELFADRVDQFAVCDAALFAAQPARRDGDLARFPRRFELIYWNVWDNARFPERVCRTILDGRADLLQPGGRLILGFYHPSRSRNLLRIDELKELGYVVDGSAEAPRGDEVIAWFNRPAPEQTG